MKTRAPAIRPEQYRNKRTGRVYTGYEGIDPGFERNPGSDRSQIYANAFADADGRWAADVRPGAESRPVSAAFRAEEGLRRLTRDTMRAADLVHGQTLDGDPITVQRDKAGLGRLGVTARDQDSGRPVAVRVLPDGPHPHLTLLHEIGHAWWYPWILDAEDIAAVMQAIRSAAPPSRGRARSRWDLIKDDDYLSDEHEAWARAYAQYVAWRSGDPRLREELNGVLTSPVAATRRTAWPWIEFVDIAEAIDKLFVAKGWQEPRTAPTSTTTENP